MRCSVVASRIQWIRHDEPGTSRKEIETGLEAALKDYKSGVKCDCGNPIWVIGSAITGNACFTCITGEAVPDSDYEIDEACN